MEEIFTFESFLNKDTKPKEPVKTEKLEESPKIIDTKEKPIVEERIVEEKSTTDIQEDNYYPLYKDISETFSCDIHIEGAKLEDTSSRLIIESDSWTLMFSGEIKDGKCIIPIRKLNLFEEGQLGKIRLEVIAEGSVFVPWEDTFKIKMSKKVSVSLNEDKKDKKNKTQEVKVTVHK